VATATQVAAIAPSHSRNGTSSTAEGLSVSLKSVVKTPR
jgi:hypothetical protein